MKFSTLLILQAVVALFFGVAFALAPAPLLALYGVTLSAAGLAIARLLGAAFLTLGGIAWFARNVGVADAQRGLVAGFCAGQAVGFIFALSAQLQGVANALGWSTVGIYLALSLGFGYFLIVSPSTHSAPGAQHHQLG
jgi:hypothetical protein